MGTSLNGVVLECSVLINSGADVCKLVVFSITSVDFLFIKAFVNEVSVTRDIASLVLSPLVLDDFFCVDKISLVFVVSSESCFVKGLEAVPEALIVFLETKDEVPFEIPEYLEENVFLVCNTDEEDFSIGISFNGVVLELSVLVNSEDDVCTLVVFSIPGVDFLLIKCFVNEDTVTGDNDSLVLSPSVLDDSFSVDKISMVFVVCGES